MSTLIALTGFAGSGKSTVAEYLHSNFSYKRTRFAAPLKAMISGLYASIGLRESEISRRIEGDLKEVPDPLLSGRTPRHAMQTLGTEWRDLMDRNLWTALWQSQVSSRCTVEDCRFEHEYRAVKEMGGIVVLVDRGGTGGGHASELGLPAHCPPDYVLDNTGDMDALAVSIGRFLFECDLPTS